MEKHLYRSTTDRVFAGVAGGLGHYFNIDATIIRLAFILFTFTGGAGPLLYLVLMVILPKESMSNQPVETKPIESSGPIPQEAQSGSNWEQEPKRRNTLAMILIGVGLIALFNQIIPTTWINWSNLWPMILILLGVILIFRR